MDLINSVFADELDKLVMAYFKDILVFDKTLDDSLQHKNIPFRELRDETLHGKLPASEISVNEVEYDCNLISSRVVSVDQQKVQSTKKWLKPKNEKNLRSLLELVSYYQRFIPHYSGTSNPQT